MVVWDCALAHAHGQRPLGDWPAEARIDPRQAEAQLDPVSVRIEQAYPDLKGWRAQLMSVRTMVSGDTRSALAVLMGAVIFVLLIACADMANLLLHGEPAARWSLRCAMPWGPARYASSANS